MTGRAYAVAGGKGGVGKTTTVVNLGVMLRVAGHRVAVVDADLGMANLGTFLGIEHEPTLHDVLAGEADVEDAIFEEPEGFAVVSGTRSLQGFAAAETERLADVVEALVEDFDFVLVDTGAGLSHEVVLPYGVAEGVLLVTTPDRAAVGDTAKTSDLVEMAGGTVIGAVVTRARGEVDRDAIAETLGTTVLGVVPEDPAIPRSVDAQKPLITVAPDSEAAAVYRQLVNDVTDVAVPEAPGDVELPGRQEDDADEGGEVEAAGEAKESPAAEPIETEPIVDEGEAADEKPAPADAGSHDEGDRLEVDDGGVVGVEGAESAAEAAEDTWSETDDGPQPEWDEEEVDEDVLPDWDDEGDEGAAVPDWDGTGDGEDEDASIPAWDDAEADEAADASNGPADGEADDAGADGEEETVSIPDSAEPEPDEADHDEVIAFGEGEEATDGEPQEAEAVADGDPADDEAMDEPEGRSSRGLLSRLLHPFG